MSHSYPIDNNKLFLVRQTVSSKAAKPAPAKGQNLVAVIDCSGSMYGQIDQVRQDLKNKISTALKPGDTFSAIWFHSRGAFGTLLEFIGVKELNDIGRIHKAIDQWLRAGGATGFKEPIESVQQLVKKFDNGNPWNMLFMSDGGENQWPRDQVLKAVEETGKVVSTCTIVEYGYYADRAFLGKMAEKAGGSHVFAQDFNAWEPVLTKAFNAQPQGGKKIEVDVKGDAFRGFVYTFNEKQGEIVTYAIEGGKVSVPADTDAIYYVSPSSVGTTVHDWVRGPGGQNAEEALTALYAAMSLFSVRNATDMMLTLLKASGDARLIDQFCNAYGKQKITELQAELTGAAFAPRTRYLGGYDPNRVPPEDAWTVLDTLKLLASDDANRVLLDSKDFKYARIGRAQIANEDALKFEADLSFAGYPVSNLVFNSERPNVSIQVVKKGKVDLREELIKAPKSVFEKLEKDSAFATQVIRNYAIIKDGLVNVDKLPVLLTIRCFEEIEQRAPNAVTTPKHGQHIDGVQVVETIIDLKAMPVINRKMVKELNDKDFVLRAYFSEKAAAEAKVYGDYYKNRYAAAAGFTRTSEGFAKQYGEEAAAWLKERGLTDQGFSPRGTSAPAVDFYMANELNVKLKGLSSLPSVKEAKEKLAKATDKKPAPIGCRLMKATIDDVEAFIAANAGRDDVIKGYLDGQQVKSRKLRRQLAAQASQDMICVILGQNWFGKTTLDPIVLSVDTPDGKIDATIEQREIEVKI